jgi:hypothetical protein
MRLLYIFEYNTEFYWTVQLHSCQPLLDKALAESDIDFAAVYESNRISIVVNHFWWPLYFTFFDMLSKQCCFQYYKKWICFFFTLEKKKKKEAWWSRICIWSRYFLLWKWNLGYDMNFIKIFWTLKLEKVLYGV